jgi:hypothetical protein
VEAVDAPPEFVEPPEEVVAAVPGEPEFVWSNFSPTLLHELNKAMVATNTKILFMFQLTHIQGDSK